MFSLVLDTSFKEIGVALYKGASRIDSVCYEAFRQQSEFLIVEIGKILKKNHVFPREIKTIFVNNGPGSYTGIRMSLAVSKTFSFCFKTNVVLVSSLVAQVGYSRKNVISVIDARADRAYVGLVKCGILLSSSVVSIGELRDLLEDKPNSSVVSNFDFGWHKFSSCKNSLDGIGEVMNKQVAEENPLRIEPFYFKEAV